MQNVTEGVTLGSVIEEVLEAKKAANRRPLYVRHLKFSLRKFATGREGVAIQSFTRKHIEEWMAARISDAPSTRKGWLQVLSVLFSFAVRADYISTNPAMQVERVSVDKPPPRILTPKEARRLVTFARRRMPWRFPQIVLGLYAGIRPTELLRLRWSDINLDQGYVTINTAAAKTRRRRIVRLEPKARDLLMTAKRRENRQLGTSSHKWRRLVEKHTGIKWNQDLLRHSCSSYLIALHGDAGKVARSLGNSVDVLLNHYVELVTPDECRRFWATPSTFWRKRI